MAQYIFLGIDRLNFEDSKTKESIKGYNFHFAQSINKPDSIGFKPLKSYKNDLAMSEFLANDAPFPDLPSYSSVIGKPCNIVFGPNNRVEGFSFPQKEAVK